MSGDTLVVTTGGEGLLVSHGLRLGVGNAPDPIHTGEHHNKESASLSVVLKLRDSCRSRFSHNLPPVDQRQRCLGEKVFTQNLVFS